MFFLKHPQFLNQVPVSGRTLYNKLKFIPKLTYVSLVSSEKIDFGLKIKDYRVKNLEKTDSI